MTFNVCIAQSAKSITSLKVVNGLAPGQKAELLKNKKVEDIQKRMESHKAGTAKIAGTRSAAKKKAAEGEVTINVSSFEPVNYCSDGWYNYLIMVFGEDADSGDEYYLALDCYPTEKSWLNAYTTEDYSLGGYYYSAINNMTTETGLWVSDDYVSTFAIERTSAEHYSVTGVLYDENGTLYNLSGTDVFFPDPKTYTQKGIKWDGYFDGSQYVGHMVTTDDAFFQLVFNLEEGQTELTSGKEYTLADMDAGYTIGYWNGNYIYPEAVTFTETVAKGGDSHIVMKVTADNGDVYDIDYVTPKLPETFTEINLVANTADLYDYTKEMGVWQFLGVSEDGKYNLSIAGISDKLEGDYSGEQIYTDFTYIGLSDLTVDITYDYGKLENVKVVAGPTEGDYICTADFYCYNGNLYHVTINHIRPAKTGTVMMAATNAKSHYDEWNEGYLISAHNAEYEFSTVVPINKSAEYYAGSLSVSLCNLATGEYESIYETYPFTVLFDENGRVTKVDGSCLAKDGTEYVFDLSYVKPNATRTVEISGELAKGELRPGDGQFVISGTTADEYTAFNLVFPADKYEGTFTLNDISEMESYFVENASNSWDATYLDIEDASINVAVSSEGGKTYATATGSVLCVSQADETDVPLYTINIKVRVMDGLVKDEPDNNFVASYALEETTLVDKSAEEGWILLQAKNVANQSIAVVFFAEASDPNIVIPEGEYAVSDTQAPGTIFKSPGLDVSGFQAQASFAAETNVLGFIKGNPWFFQSGKAVVRKVEDKLSVQITAKNSYGCSILVGINSEIPTGISIADSQAKRHAGRKTLVGHQVIIENNGLRFNTGGQRVR